MNFQFYVEKLRDSDSYKKFVKENKDSFCCSCFFVIDLVDSEKGDKQHFDFFNPLSEDKKVYSFQLEKSCELVPVEVFDEKIPKEISFDHDFDFKQIEDLIVSKMGQAGIKNKIQKMLFSLQKRNGKEFLIGTVFITGLGMIKVLIDIKEMKVTEFEKKSFFDVLKVKRGGKND